MTAIRCPGCFTNLDSAVPCPVCGHDPHAPRSPLILPPGTPLDAALVVGRVLGKPGGFGITYLGWDRHLETRVAIKEYLPRDLAGRASDSGRVQPHTHEEGVIFQDGLKQFLTEAQTLAQLDHPNIVRVRQFFEANDTAYLVMDYYEGLSLAEYLDQQGGRLPEDAARRLMLPVLDGLRAVHAKGFLHRDIKPQNLYLARLPSGGIRPILLDFGTARQAVGERSRLLSVIVSPGYAPYEQYHRKGQQGPWTDLYAIAAVLYQMVTGQTPPEATERLVEDDLQSATVYGVSPELSAVLAEALAIAPEQRPQTVAAFQQRLDVRPSPEPAPRSSSKPSVSAPYRRRGLIPVALLLMVTALAAGGGWYGYDWQARQQAEQRAMEMAHQALMRAQVAELETKRLAEEARLADIERQRDVAEQARMQAEQAQRAALARQADFALPPRTVDAPTKQRQTNTERRDGRFLVDDNGTIRDPDARLMWVAKDNQEDINWFEAVRYVEMLRVGGYSDWRLPTMNELKRLFQTGANMRRPAPGCSGGYRIANSFHLTCGVLWSADREGQGAYALNLVSGKVHHDDPLSGGHRRVLAVRSD